MRVLYIFNAYSCTTTVLYTSIHSNSLVSPTAAMKQVQVGRRAAPTFKLLKSKTFIKFSSTVQGSSPSLKYIGHRSTETLDSIIPRDTPETNLHSLSFSSSLRDTTAPCLQSLLSTSWAREQKGPTDMDISIWFRSDLQTIFLISNLNYNPKVKFKNQICILVV